MDCFARGLCADSDNKEVNYPHHRRWSGVGVTKPISSVPLFSHFLALSEHTLAIEYHVYIWQVSPQLSCGATCQIYTWFKESKRYFCQIENFACGEINERSFSNPHPSTDCRNAHLLWSLNEMDSWEIIYMFGPECEWKYSGGDISNGKLTTKWWLDMRQYFYRISIWSSIWAIEMIKWVLFSFSKIFPNRCVA